MPFHKSPQLAAISTTFLTFLLSIIAMLLPESTTTWAIYTLFFPPGFYVFSIKAVAHFESRQTGAVVGSSTSEGAADAQALRAVLGVAVVDIFLWMFIAGMIERFMFEPGARDRDSPASLFSWLRRSKSAQGENAPSVLRNSDGRQPVPAAITLHNITKTFKAAKRGAPRITAVENLSLSIPSCGIFVLLGANGSGKSTTLGMVAGLEEPDSGRIEFHDEMTTVDEKGEDNRRAYPHTRNKTALGLVPQKDILFPELTCYQTIRLWRDLKAARLPTSKDQDLETLLDSCSLRNKMHARAGTLSGGQKRRLQLAAGLVGGSRVVLVDEATSGVDPLSRRAIWRALRDVREDRCIVFTTHVSIRLSSDLN